MPELFSRTKKTDKGLRNISCIYKILYLIYWLGGVDPKGKTQINLGVKGTTKDVRRTLKDTC